MSTRNNFRGITEELRQAEALHEAAIARAFHSLEQQDPALAHRLLENLGDRQRAARWMCLHQRAFGGRTAYELLAEGDLDTVWDRVTGDDQLTRTPQTRVAY
jgi:hypothetical protein